MVEDCTTGRDVTDADAMGNCEVGRLAGEVDEARPMVAAVAATVELVSPK